MILSNTFGEHLSFIKFFLSLLIFGLLIVLNIEYLPESLRPFQQPMDILFYGILTFLYAKFNFSEYLQNTFRSPASVLRLTGKEVLGIIPNIEIKKQYVEMTNSSFAHLAHRIQKLKSVKVYNGSFIVGLFSLEQSEGKSFVGSILTSYFSRINKQSCILMPAEIASGTLIKALETYDIIFLEYPALKEDTHNLSFNNNNLNVIISRSNRVWNYLDKSIINKLCKRSKSDPCFVLNFHKYPSH